MILVMKMLILLTMMQAFLVTFTKGLTEKPCDGHETLFKCKCTKIENLHCVFEKKLNCAGQNYSDIPSFLPVDLVHLDLSNNLILPENIKHLSHYKLLRHVSLAHNNLSKIPARSFENCSTLVSLNLQGNVMARVNRETMIGLQYLQSFLGLEALEFDSSTFDEMQSLFELAAVFHQEVIPAGLLRTPKLKKFGMNLKTASHFPSEILQGKNETLIELAVISETLTQIDEDVFFALALLKEIKLDVKNMKTLPAAIFNRNDSSLHTSQDRPVYLDKIFVTGVKSLPSTIFCGLRHIKKIIIHGSEEIPGNIFKGLSTLDTLDLSGCRFARNVLPNGLLADVAALTILHLSECNISVIRPDDFPAPLSLSVLDLSFNNICSLDKQPFELIRSNLQTLRLNRNTISRIDRDTFSGMLFLQLLDLSFNNLKEIRTGLFSDLRHLNQLILAGNHLHTIQAGEFRRMPYLAILNLKFNNIEHIPFQNMTALRHLEVLDVLNNPLNCTSDFCTGLWSIRWAAVFGTCSSPEEHRRHAVMKFATEKKCVRKEARLHPMLMPSMMLPIVQHDSPTTIPLSDLPTVIESTPDSISTSMQTMNILNVTVVAVRQKDKSASESFYIALLAILGVAIFCVAAIVLLYRKNKQNGRQSFRQLITGKTDIELPIIRVSQYEMDITSIDNQPTTNYSSTDTSVSGVQNELATCTNAKHKEDI